MKIDLGYGDVMRLAEAYGHETAEYVKGAGKVGALAAAHDDLQKAVMQLEYLAFKNPPCKICKHANEPPVGTPCCDCLENQNGWSMFEPIRN